MRARVAQEQLLASSTSTCSGSTKYNLFVNAKLVGKAPHWQWCTADMVLAGRTTLIGLIQSERRTADDEINMQGQAGRPTACVLLHRLACH
jgi:hypothetical protein